MLDREARHAGEPPSGALARLVATLRAERDPSFAFHAPRPIPITRAARPLAATRVALVSVAGLHRRGDARFRVLEDPAGDGGLRIVPQALPAGELALEEAYVDARFVRRDPEVALPRLALARLAADGRVGAAAPRHGSFCGGLLRPYPELGESAQEFARVLAEDGAGAAVLLAGCTLCAQTQALLAQELEARGTPTVALTLLPELTAIVGAPRALSVRFPFGAPAGDPGNGALHEAVLEEALALLHTAERPGRIVASRHAWRRSPLPARGARE